MSWIYFNGNLSRFELNPSEQLLLLLLFAFLCPLFLSCLDFLLFRSLLTVPLCLCCISVSVSVELDVCVCMLAVFQMAVWQLLLPQGSFLSLSSLLLPLSPASNWTFTVCQTQEADTTLTCGWRLQRRLDLLSFHCKTKNPQHPSRGKLKWCSRSFSTLTTTAEKRFFEPDVHCVAALLLHHRNTPASVPPDRLMITSVSTDQRRALFCTQTQSSAMSSAADTQLLPSFLKSFLKLRHWPRKIQCDSRLYRSTQVIGPRAETLLFTWLIVDVMWLRFSGYLSFSHLFGPEDVCNGTWTCGCRCPEQVNRLLKSSRCSHSPGLMHVNEKTIYTGKKNLIVDVFEPFTPLCRKDWELLHIVAVESSCCSCCVFQCLQSNNEIEKFVS